MSVKIPGLITLEIDTWYDTANNALKAVYPRVGGGTNAGPAIAA